MVFPQTLRVIAVVCSAWFGSIPLSTSLIVGTTLSSIHPLLAVLGHGTEVNRESLLRSIHVHSKVLVLAFLQLNGFVGEHLGPCKRRPVRIPTDNREHVLPV